MSFRTRIIASLAFASFLAFVQSCSSGTACPSACSADQVCDTSTRTCVPVSGGCQSNADCTGSNHVCDAASGQCVGCLADGDCAGGTCDPTTLTCSTPQCRTDNDCKGQAGSPFCSADGSCVQCRTSIDCFPVNGVRQTCDAGTHQCLMSPCKMDSDCSLDPTGAMYCDTAKGGCVQCLSDQECPGEKPHCVPTDHVCGACATDADCDATIGQTCTADTHVCKVTKCVSDASCDGAQRCDFSTGQCVECRSNADCYFGGICTGEKCVQPASCSTDTDCLFGTYCQNSTCVGCRRDADCATGQTCAAGACQEPAMCQSPTQCLSGRTCTMGACAAATCMADPGEPNDAVNDATPLTVGSMVSLQATICPNDVDNYVVSFPTGSGGVFTVKSDASLPALTLDLYAGPGSPPMHVTGTSAQPGVLTAQIDSAPTGSDALLVRVGGGQGQSVPYELDANVQVGGLCTTSGPPDDTIAEAPVVTPGSYPGTLCPNDQNWLALDVPANNRLTVAFNSTAPGQGIAVEIRKMVNGQPALQAYATTDGFGNATATSSSVAAAGGERYWVQIYNLEQVKQTYTANVSFIPQAPPNDQCPNATLLSPQASTIGHLQGATHDLQDACGGAGGDAFWKLQLTSPSQVELDLSASFSAVLSLMQACNGSGELGCSAASAGAHSLKFEALRPGTYYVRVAGATATDVGDYTLSTQVSPAQPATNALCTSPIPLAFTGMDANMNPQATASGSVALAADNVTSGCGQTGGDAVYSLTLTADQMVVANLQGFPGAALSLVPIASCSTPSAGKCAAADSTGATTLKQNVVPAGTYAVVVDGGNVVAGQYSLTVTLLPPLYPPPNDTCASPAELADGTVTGDTRGANDDAAPPAPMCGTGGSAGDVVYHFSVSGADQQVTLQLDASFDAAMVVTNSPCMGGTFIDCSNGDHERLVLPDLPAGDYYVWVDGYDTGVGTFTLSKASVPAQPPPTNLTCAAATPVDLSMGPVTVMGSTLRADDTLHPTACQPPGASMALQLTGPNVVYSVTIPAGKTLSAVLDPIDFDGALYVLNTCTDNTCVAGSDSSLQAGGQESLQLANSSTSDESVFVVVDSWVSEARGDFSLQLQLR